MANDTGTRTGSKEIVLACVHPLNEEDFTTARKYIADNFSFVGVVGTPMVQARN